MKNLIKRLLFIAMISIILFSLTTCDIFGPDTIPNKYHGTWVNDWGYPYSPLVITASEVVATRRFNGTVHRSEINFVSVLIDPSRHKLGFKVNGLFSEMTVRISQDGRLIVSNIQYRSGGGYYTWETFTRQ